MGDIDPQTPSAGHAAVPHQHTKAVADQLARAAGHVLRVKRMVEDGRGCPEGLVQLAAVRAALDRAAQLRAPDHAEPSPRGAAVHRAAAGGWLRPRAATDSL